MFPDDGRVGHTLGARRTDVVLVQDFEHARSRQAGDPRRREETERDRRQEDVLPAAPPRRREHVELDREKQNQHDAEPERRHRLTQQRDHRRDVVDQGIATHCRDDSCRDRETERERERRAGELERRRHPFHHEIEGGLAVADRLSEVAAQSAREEAAVLNEEGIIEAHLLAELRDVFDARVGRKKEKGRVARQEQDAEYHERNAEEDEKGLQQSPKEIDLHVRRRRATASMCGVWGNMSTGCTHSRT